MSRHTFFKCLFIIFCAVGYWACLQFNDNIGAVFFITGAVLAAVGFGDSDKGNKDKEVYQ